jgi:hypothetical protein
MQRFGGSYIIRIWLSLLLMYSWITSLFPLVKFSDPEARLFFSLTSNIRAFVATTHDIPAEPLTPLAAKVDIAPLPEPWDPAQDLKQACTDPLYESLSPNEQECFLNSMFVDDNGIAASVSSRYLACSSSKRGCCLRALWFSEEDRRQSCLNNDKWEKHVSHIMRYL